MTRQKNLPLGPITAFCLLALACGISGNALAQLSLEGAWVLEQTKDSAGNVDSEPLRALMIFTASHYSIMAETGTKPRAMMEQNPNDTQLLEAYASFTANSGRYEVGGNQFTIYPYVAKSPNFTANWPAPMITFTFSLDGNTLTLLNAQGGESIYRNVDDEPPPWEP